MEYKYKAKVIITLESNNLPSLREIAHRYFSAKIGKRMNNPDEPDKYVAVTRETNEPPIS